VRSSLACSVVLFATAVACGSNQNGLFGQKDDAGSQAGGSGGQAGAGCEMPCTAGEARCDQDSVQTCLADAVGCTSWNAPQACPGDKPFCSNGACDGSCADECAASGDRACAGAGYHTCGQFDSDPCLDWSEPTSCEVDLVCREPGGACVLGECKPGRPPEMEPCGNCGMRKRSCNDDGTWGPWADCTDEGACAPGASETTACGSGGSQTRTCTATCDWGPYGSCVSPTDCTPGQVDQEPCGNCGAQTRTCSSQGTWPPWGPCSGGGVCSVGAKQTQTCNIVGTQTSTCNSTCSWSDWGPCAGANPAPLDGGDGTFLFPRSGDGSKPGSSSTGFSMTDVGSYVIGARTTTLPVATSFSSTIQYNNYLANSYTCHVTYDIYLNGTKIGSSGAGNQQTSSAVNLSFPAIAGPTYTILYVTTASPTETGCGALYLKKDTSSVTLK
jgi:hypothetical protein